MDFVLLHLRVNHFPICLGALGAAAAIVAAIVRKDAVWKYAQITMLAAALTAPAAQWTGKKANSVVGSRDDLTGIQERMETHEASAEKALYCMLAAGAAAAVALWKQHPAARWTFLAFSLGGVAAIGWTSKQGGEIIHAIPLSKLAEIDEPEPEEE